MRTLGCGTAPRGTQFTATSREGDWVQVENPNWKGWISSQFSAPNEPLQRLRLSLQSSNLLTPSHSGAP
jgi:hypothetical protein